MIITFNQARQLIARYAGKSGYCATSPEVANFVKVVLQELLSKGVNGNLRKWVFYTQNGLFTAPPDLELPVSVRIDGETIHRPGFVYDKWYEFYDQSTLAECVPWEEGLVEEINTYFTSYDLPACGSQILAIPFCKEDDDAHFIIGGTDRKGREIYLPNDGIIDKGERLSISKDEPRFTEAFFKSINFLSKTKTNHYVRLYAYNPENKKRSLLGEYRPTDTLPSFRRFRVVESQRNRGFLKVTILGRVRVQDDYSENDVLPVTNPRALRLMAQTIQAEDNDSIQIASYKNKRVDEVIDSENYAKRTPQAPVNFEDAVSPATTIKNLI